MLGERTRRRDAALDQREDALPAPFRESRLDSAVENSRSELRLNLAASVTRSDMPVCAFLDSTLEETPLTYVASVYYSPGEQICIDNATYLHVAPVMTVNTRARSEKARKHRAGSPTTRKEPGRIVSSDFLDLDDFPFRERSRG